MINPYTVNPITLPSVALQERSLLPTTPCIYFAIDSQGVIQYIGQSKNPALRWINHHRYSFLSNTEGIRIAYLLVDASLLLEVEKALIDYFNPPLNGLRIVRKRIKRSRLSR